MELHIYDVLASLDYLLLSQPNTLKARLAGLRLLATVQDALEPEEP